MPHKDDVTDKLSPDKPLISPADDRLGYAPFAERLADSIQSMAPPEGLTIALFGPWGSGKTTLLHFVIHYLEQQPETERVVIVPFNPWFFSGHEDLTRRFFDQLQAAITSKWRAVGKELPRLMANLARLVSEAPVPYASTGKILARLFGPKQKDVYALKRRIAEGLRKHKKRIVVVIDDIDRLTSDEIRQLFRVVRAVADFPNVIYLLAFDKEVVTKALVEAQALPGEAYLQKIVQVPFELPFPGKTAIRRLLFERLNAILGETPNESFDRNYWSQVYLEGIDRFISTPRDVVRLTNTLSVTYPHVKGEVNPVDFIAVEALRVFRSAVYDIIRKNRDEFAGYLDGGWPNPVATTETARSFHSSWMDQLPAEEQEAIKALLKHLFPKLESLWTNMSYGPTDQSAWRRQLRVCSPDRFATYFRLAVPEGSISNAEMKTILSLAGDKHAFADRLIALASQLRPDGTTRVRAFLELLEDYTSKEIPLEHIPSIVAAILHVGDGLLRPEDERRWISDIGNDVRIERVLGQLLRRLDEPRRFEVLRKAMSDGCAISTVVREIAVLGQEHGKYGQSAPPPEKERIVTAEHLQQLERVGLEKIRELASQGEALLHSHQPLGILYRWRDWTDTEDEVKEWVLKITANDSGLLALLEQCLQKVLVESGTDIPRTEYDFDFRGVSDFLDPHQIIERVKQLSLRSDLTGNQRTAVEQFISQYERAQQNNDGAANEQLTPTE